ncbi:MAG: NAD-dependent epimerase/dehydratase family protein [Betaproteobacteria bacterium]|nr:MAG: NAD-dependent epimerase/dehydratase family protein [Betaproteobacteria bacterium]
MRRCCGGAGYIGSHVAKQLGEAGHDVTAPASATTSTSKISPKPILRRSPTSNAAATLPCSISATAAAPACAR